MAESALRWPRPYRSAAVITVNLDGEAAVLRGGPSEADQRKTRSIFSYGVSHGAPRLLELFGQRGVATTWFVPGWVARTHPETLRAVVAGGHGLGVRGDLLERFDVMESTERREVLARAVASVGAVTDARVGFRLPIGEWPAGLGGELADAGIEWSSSWFGDDLPMTLPLEGGRSLVDIPITYALDDRVAFSWNVNPPMPIGQSRIPPYAEVLQNWLMELEGCREEGLCFVLQLHPELTGTPGRISLVAELLDTLATFPDIWVATAADVATWWARQHPGNEPGHPLDTFRSFTRIPWL